MMLLHFLQRILRTLPCTLSSAIAYLVLHFSQANFMHDLSLGTLLPQDL